MFCKLPKLERCCCLFPLTKGALIIAYLEVVVNFGLLILSVLSIARVAEQFVRLQRSHKLDVIDRNLDIFVFLTMGKNIVLRIIEIGFAFSLIRGLKNNRPHLVRVYIYFVTIFSLFDFVSTLTNVSLIDSYDIYAVLASLALKAYFLVVLRSAHQKMLTTESQPDLLRISRRQSNAPTNLDSTIPQLQVNNFSSRYGAVYRPDFTSTLKPCAEEKIEEQFDEKEDVSEIENQKTSHKG